MVEESKCKSQKEQVVPTLEQPLETVLKSIPDEAAQNQVEALELPTDQLATD